MSHSLIPIVATIATLLAVPLDGSFTKGTADVGRVGGISGLTNDDETFWAVPERDRLLFAFQAIDGRLVRTRPPLPLVGVPKGLDTEAITWLGGQRFALGTEANRIRDHDLVLIVTTSSHSARVTDTIRLPFSTWPKFRAESNRGIEGVCHAAGHLLVVLETPASVDGARVAPLGLYDLRTGRWVGRWVRLTTAQGKLSALSCRNTGGEILVHAIERHYGVSRIVRFVVRPGAGAVPLVPTLVADLDPLYATNPNFEGLSLRDGMIVLISDNQGAVISGATHTLISTSAPRRYTPPPP